MTRLAAVRYLALLPRHAVRGLLSEVPWEGGYLVILVPSLSLVKTQWRKVGEGSVTPLTFELRSISPKVVRAGMRLSTRKSRVRKQGTVHCMHKKTRRDVAWTHHVFDTKARSRTDSFSFLLFVLSSSSSLFCLSFSNFVFRYFGDWRNNAGSSMSQDHVADTVTILTSNKYFYLSYGQITISK